MALYFKAHNESKVSRLTPSRIDVRTRGYGYGGGAYVLTQKGTVVFAQGGNQIYLIDYKRHRIVDLWHPKGWRFCNGTYDPFAERIICIGEKSQGRKSFHALVSISPWGRSVAILHEKFDFYSNPQISRCGRFLAYIAWNHPNMPWDSSVLNIAELTPSGPFGHTKQVLGHSGASVAQPLWNEDGSLSFVSDKAGWWNLYEWNKGKDKSVMLKCAEFAQPQWKLGVTNYGEIAENGYACSVFSKGQWRLVALSRQGKCESAPYQLRSIMELKTFGRTVFVIGSNSTHPVSICSYDFDTCRWTEEHRVAPRLQRDRFPSPQHLRIPVNRHDYCYGIYYAPRISLAKARQRPVTIIMLHGGPTAVADEGFDFRSLFFRSNGFAMLHLNYRGSFGYGRKYRKALNSNWGIADVQDTRAAARFLIKNGLASRKRIVLRGISAGGYTALCSLSKTEMFAGGVVISGIADLKHLEAMTHKFESKYLFSLLGKNRHLYWKQRSPIHFAQDIGAPILLAHGGRDPVVPRGQIIRLAKTLRRSDKQVDLMIFDDEHHGIFIPANIALLLRAELRFYMRVTSSDQTT